MFLNVTGTPSSSITTDVVVMLLSSARDPVMDDLVKLDVEYSVAFWDNSVTL